MIIVREFDMESDLKAVVEMEQRCEAGSSSSSAAANAMKKKQCSKNKKKSSMSLVVDTMGDPMARIRHTPEHIMMVAEYGERKEMVGVIRATVKMVTRGRRVTSDDALPIFAKVAYILGLRVSPSHRRMGIGTRLVESVEAWCRSRGAEYAYMATDRSNSASLALFTRRLAYTRFRSPALLVHPVHPHPLPLPRHHLLSLPQPVAAAVYRRLLLPSSEFLPADLPAVLSNPLSLATLFATPPPPSGWDPRSILHGSLPESFAMLSVWDCGGSFRLRVAGASRLAQMALALARTVDRRLCMRFPVLRDVFRPFGVYFTYGLFMQGPEGAAMMRTLCRAVHNMAVEDEGCAAVVAEVGMDDPVRRAVPHWRRLSCDEDVWCIKSLKDGGDGSDGWLKAAQSPEVIFVDPREF